MDLNEPIHLEKKKTQQNDFDAIMGKKLKDRSKTSEYSVVYWYEADFWEMSDWILWQIFLKVRHILLFYVTALTEMLQSVDVNLNSVGSLSNHCDVQRKKSKHGSRGSELSLLIVTSCFRLVLYVCALA